MSPNRRRDHPKDREDIGIFNFYHVFGLQIANNMICPIKMPKGSVSQPMSPMFHGGGAPVSFVDKLESTAVEANVTTLENITEGLQMAPIFRYVEKFILIFTNEKGFKKLGEITSTEAYKCALLYNGMGDLDMSASAHASSWTMDEVGSLRNPTLSSLCEADEIMSLAQLRHVTVVMKEEDTVPCDTNVYPNTVHCGDACPNLADPQAKASFEAAFAQAALLEREDGLSSLPMRPPG
ncbi:hypothetical protein K437DRAFT_275102 [Tilletiaria anomala UBC 951]|uniref:Uncharacterized protein n=1 Tax=Tilletiaria anomala (strain ATCC 24038 / CBS 436.72 / UBC 951) TaxID=1037660 RepID=A0A066VVL5_TILAU|nr:uncharacterized protein K437DRAFT_275102 [Tilletiaria anomala UBC 951]KDN42605.1 hypothetical protein K437DRAFT_275102 [Tilletiaria anomala UBC 951]